MDVTDRWGVTPLMYAAAMGMGDVVQLLISKGANITTRARHFNRDFMHYASVRGHWDLILESLNTIRLYNSDEQFFQQYVRKAIYHLVFNGTWLGDSRTKYFESLLGLCEDVNFTFGDHYKENNLLHYVETEKEFQALIRHGFHGFNKPNSDGDLPLNYIVHKGSKVDLIRRCLDNGADVNHINHSDRTVIFELLQCLEYLDCTTWDTVDSIKLCLDRGLHISHTDSCICACSLNGCNTSSAFYVNFTNAFRGPQPDFIWAFEWLSIVEEFCGYEESRALLLSFIRRTRFDLLNLTHFCCHRGEGLRPYSNSYSQPSPEDVQEILNEEQEPIQILEEEMQRYNSEGLDALRSEWMILLKLKYDKAAAGAQARRAISGVSSTKRNSDHGMFQLTY
jgi:ankyrin repeat protein